MAFAQGSRSQLTYIAESTFNTTPSTPSMVLLPINTHSISLQKEGIESGEIRSDRQVAVFRHGNQTVAGTIEAEFRPTDFDPFLEAALFGSFSSSVLKLGTTFKSFTIEDGALDIAQYRPFTGCAVNSMSMNIEPNAIVTVSFDIIGAAAGTASGTSLDASPTAVTSDTPFDSFSGSINEGGSSIASITSIEFTVENSINPAFVIGSSTAPQLEYGRGRVTGTVNAYFEDVTLYNKFVNETESSLDFTLASSASGDSYTIDFPRVKYNGGDIPLDNEQSRIISIPFVALYDETETTSIVITKS